MICYSLRNVNDCKRQSFPGLPEQEKCEVLNALGSAACAMAGNSLSRPVGVISKNIPLCQACDSEDFKDGSVPQWRCSDFDELWGILAYVLSKLTRAPGLRITAIIALRRALVHAPNSSQMQLVSSIFGEFCLHSLRSSIRELRIITGYVHYCFGSFYQKKKLTKFRYTVTAFIRRNLNPDIRRSNFVVILEWLRNLSEKHEASLHETCILTLCRLARYVLSLFGQVLGNADAPKRLSNDEEMNIILLHLVEYLGHSNPFVSAVAYTEVCIEIPGCCLLPFFTVLFLLGSAFCA